MTDTYYEVELSMRLVVNAVAARAGGGLRHLEQLMTYLPAAAQEAGVDLIVALNHEIGSLFQSSATILPVDAPPGISLKRVLWDAVGIRGLLKASDVLLSPLNTGTPVVQVPQILFQRNTKYFDREYLAHTSPRTRFRYATQRTISFASAKSSRVVVVPSAAMAAMVRSYWPNEKLVVLPHAFDYAAARSSNAPIPSGALRWASADSRLLYVSYPWRHKNLITVARTLRFVNRDRPGTALAVTFRHGESPEFDAEVDSDGLCDHVSYLGPLDQDAVYALYRAASVALYPSFSESFGYPAIEAMALGCPLVASSLPVISELVGDYGRYHEPSDAERAAEHVNDILDGRGAQPSPGLVEATLIRHAWPAYCDALLGLVRQHAR